MLRWKGVPEIRLKASQEGEPEHNLEPADRQVGTIKLKSRLWKAVVVNL